MRKNFNLKMNNNKYMKNKISKIIKRSKNKFNHENIFKN